MNGFREWLQKNATLYTGNNASDCMEAAYNAGLEHAAEIVDCWGKQLTDVGLADAIRKEISNG